MFCHGAKSPQHFRSPWGWLAHGAMSGDQPFSRRAQLDPWLGPGGVKFDQRAGNLAKVAVGIGEHPAQTLDRRFGWRVRHEMAREFGGEKAIGAGCVAR